MWNSLTESVEFRSLASFIRTVTVVDLSDHLKCFSNMFVFRAMLEHVVPFCPVKLHCILSLTNCFLYEQNQINDDDDDDDKRCRNVLL